MKAIVCTRYGPPDVLRLWEVETPIPSDHEVRIKIHAISVTVGDTRVRGFDVPLSFWLPARIALGLRKPRIAILGSVFAGEIESTGKGVTLFKKGDRVFASSGHRFGAYAENRCMPESGCLAIMPANVSYGEAAAIPWGGLAALHFLKKGNIRSGQKVLIYGASGSIGTAAIQLAKHLGAEVAGVCSTSNLNLVKSLGADAVIDYTREEFSKRSGFYDIVFDTVGKSPLSSCIKALKKNGTCIHAVATPALSVHMQIASITSGRRFIGGTYFPKAEDLIYLRDLVEAGKMKPVIDRYYSLEQMVEAHRYVDKGHKKGNVVVNVGELER